MKSSHVKVGNTTYHLPTFGPMSFKNFKKTFPNLRNVKEIYDLIYLEYHGKPNDYKGKGAEEPATKVQEKPTELNNGSELAVSEPAI